MNLFTFSSFSGNIFHKKIFFFFFCIFSNSNSKFSVILCLFSINTKVSVASPKLAAKNEININENKNERDVFYVSNTKNTKVKLGKPHQFDKVIINRGDIFKPSTNTVNLGSKGYWFAFSVTSNNYLGSLNNSDTEFRQDPRPEKSTTSQFELFLNKTNTIAAQQVYYNTTVIGSGKGSETSWLGFQVNTLAVFTGLNNLNTGVGPITFDNTTYNSGYFAVDDSKIKVLFPSYYYLSFAYPTRRDVSTILKVNSGLIPGSEVNLQTLNYLSTSTACKSLIVELKKDDVIELEILDGSIFSAEASSTMLSLISIGDSSHFASVFRTNDFIASDITELRFQIVQYNRGNSWDLEENHFKCKSSGIYKVSISLGARYNAIIIVEIMKNKEVVGRLQSIGGDDVERRIISRSLLVELRVDDTLSVQGMGITDVGVTSTTLNIFKI